MSRQRIIDSETAAVPVAREFNAEGYASIVVEAYYLAGVETVSIYTQDPISGADFPVYVDGAALTLTVVAPAVVLEGGLRYGFTKSATAAEVSVDVIARRLG